MRQVEFNAVLVDRLRESSRALSILDQNIQELYSAWTAVKNQADAQAARQQEVERRLASLNDAVIACRVRVKRALDPLVPCTRVSAETRENFAGPAFDYFLFFNQF